ncbi:hypothetical protein TNCV_3010261 [Trichonephila clavipes]|nr:hypothetical protein TNCV_3010261 [Trichonephila clavipes]
MIAGCETNFIRVLDKKRRASIWWPERKVEARTTVKLDPIGDNLPESDRGKHRFRRTLIRRLSARSYFLLVLVRGVDSSKRST